MEEALGTGLLDGGGTEVGNPPPSGRDPDTERQEEQQAGLGVDRGLNSSPGLTRVDRGRQEIPVKENTMHMSPKLHDVLRGKYASRMEKRIHYLGLAVYER